MRNRLIIEGNAVYELDEECVRKKQGREPGGKLIPETDSRTPKPKAQGKPM